MEIGVLSEFLMLHLRRLQVMIPDPFPLENLWSLRTFRNDSAVTEASEAIQGVGMQENGS